MSTPTKGTSSQQSKTKAQSKPSNAQQRKGGCRAHEERKETQQAIQKKPSPLLSQRTEIAQPRKNKQCNAAQGKTEGHSTRSRRRQLIIFEIPGRTF